VTHYDALAVRFVTILALRSCVLALAIAFAWTTDAQAQTVTPPSILESVDAVYPDAALLAARGTVVVQLRIVIEEDGTVSDATVLAPQGDGLDEAAVAAIRRFRFEPARRDGVAIRVAIPFAFEIREPAPTEEPTEPTEPIEPPPPPPGRLVGQLFDARGSTPLPEVDVALLGSDGTERFVVTDAEGRFAFDDVPPGTYRVAARPIGLPESENEEVVASGEETAVTYRLATSLAADDHEEPIAGARAVVDPPPREVTRRTIERDVMMSIPGTRGDPLRAIEILPGIARPPFGLGLVIVRGSAPGDTEVLLDGVPIPQLYHFGGLTSVFNGRLLQRIDFYPGNFSSRYGRKMGGIIEVDTRDPATDRIHGNVETSVIDGSILLEGPITPKFSIAGSVRRSFIDLFFNALVPTERLSVTAAPVYYDYQLFATWRPTDADRIRFRFYGSDDRFRLFLGSGFADDPQARGSLGLATRFNFFQTNWQHRYSTNAEHDVVFQVGPTRLKFNAFQSLRFDLQLVSIYGRSEWRVNVNDHVRVVAGIDINTGHFDIVYRGPPAGTAEGNTQDQQSREVRLHNSGYGIRPGVYVDAAFTMGRVVVNTALRGDYYSEIQGWSIDPRLIANYRPIENLRLKAGAGLYSQPPEYQESARGLGNPNLEAIHAAHFGLGGDWTIRPGIEVGLEGFYKQLWNRVVQTPQASGSGFTNGGIGRIYGMELSGRIQPTEGRPYFGYLSYTLMRSERRDHEGDPFRLFDFDQTHIFTAAFSYRFLRHHWEIGSTVRFVSGNPYTPVAQGVFDPVNQSRYPVPGMTNSARNPFFNRIDIRIEKQWWFSGWKLALFLDIQNVLNRKNQEALFYNYDFTDTASVSGLPIIPSLGLRGEF